MKINAISNEVRIEQIWSEYEYRHNHIWKVVFQLTLAVVALSITPYLNASDKAGVFQYIPLILASVLALFCMLRIKQEFALFSPIKHEYLARTRTDYKEIDSSFDFHVKLYLMAIFVGSLLHAILLLIALNFQYI